MNNDIDNLRNGEVEKLHNLSIKNLQESIQVIINDPVYQLSDNFWE